MDITITKDFGEGGADTASSGSLIDTATETVNNGLEVATEAAEQSYEEGKFCIDANTCFDVSTDEGRQALIAKMGASKSDKVLMELQAYVNEHHPERNISEVIGSEIINTILAGFFSGRTATAGAGPLTAVDAPPSIAFEVDEGTIEWLAKAAGSLTGHGVQFVRGLIGTAAETAITTIADGVSGAKETTGKENFGDSYVNATDKLDKGILVSKDSIWGKLPTWMNSWVEASDNGDGTLTINKKGTPRGLGELSGDIALLLVGPGKAKAGARAAVGTVLKSKPKSVRQALGDSLSQSVGQWKKINGAKTFSFNNIVKDKVSKIAVKDLAGSVSKTSLVAGSKSAGHKALKSVSPFLPLAAEWQVAETLAMNMFDKYGSVLSDADKRAWANWFAFNYVWADLTVQGIDSILSVIYSLRGQRKDDLKTIGGLIMKIMVAEIISGATIIGSIGLTKIQKGEITAEEYFTSMINLDFKAAGLDKPVTSTEVLQALAGETSNIGKDFDVVEIEGRQYTIKPQSKEVITDEGKLLQRGSPEWTIAWDTWKAKQGSKAFGSEQLIEGSLVAQ